jgi:hypothetical protein
LDTHFCAEIQLKMMASLFFALFAQQTLRDASKILIFNSFSRREVYDLTN